MQYDNRCWAVVDLDALAHNYRLLRTRLSPQARFMAIIKANAYGHGSLRVAALLQELGADWFGAATLAEALELREGGITKPILILGYTPPEEAEILAGQQITQAVFSARYAAALSKQAAAAGVQVDVHLKLDSGMNRLGFSPREREKIKAVYTDPHLECSGIFTHFAVADEFNPDSRAETALQFDRFTEICRWLSAEGIDPGIRHCCNSAGALTHPEMHLDMARFGIVLYGLAPSAEMQDEVAGLRPMMELYARIAMLKEIGAGEGVSYGLKDQKPFPRTVATVPIGYADGYQRALSSKGEALVGGHLVRVIGRVCMDQLMLDVTGVPELCEGAIVTFAGRQGEQSVTFERMAELAGTISYELVCALSPRVPRIYRIDGKMK